MCPHAVCRQSEDVLCRAAMRLVMGEKMKKYNIKNNIRSWSRCRVLPAVLLAAALLLSACGNGAGRQTEQDTLPENSSTADTLEESSSSSITFDTSDFAATQASISADTADTATTETAAEEKGPVFSAKGRNLTIVIDPGHCSQVPEGTEPIGPGASETKEADTVGNFGKSSSTFEYDLTMNVSKKLRSELEKRGYKVILTHQDTVQPISGAQRAAVANNNKADAFIQIHANSADDSSVHGARTICITEDNPWHPELFKSSYRLSKVILDTYCEKTGARKERIWKTDTMTANNWSSVPAAMIELGYMSNPDEDLNMNMDSYRKKMALALADGLDLWFAQMPQEELPLHPGFRRGAAGNENAALSGTAPETAATNQPVTGAVPPAGTTPSGSFDQTDPSAIPPSADPAAVAPGTVNQPGTAVQPGQTVPQNPAASYDVNSAAEMGTPYNENTGYVPQTGTPVYTDPGVQPEAPYDINAAAEQNAPTPSSSGTPEQGTVPYAPGSFRGDSDDAASLYFTTDTDTPANWDGSDGSDSMEFSPIPDDSYYPGVTLTPGG